MRGALRLGFTSLRPGCPPRTIPGGGGTAVDLQPGGLCGAAASVRYGWALTLLIQSSRLYPMAAATYPPATSRLLLLAGERRCARCVADGSARAPSACDGHVSLTGDCSSVLCLVLCACGVADARRFRCEGRARSGPRACVRDGALVTRATPPHGESLSSAQSGRFCPDTRESAPPCTDGGAPAELYGSRPPWTRGVTTWRGGSRPTHPPFSCSIGYAGCPLLPHTHTLASFSQSAVRVRPAATRTAHSPRTPLACARLMHAERTWATGTVSVAGEQ